MCPFHHLQQKPLLYLLYVLHWKVYFSMLVLFHCNAWICLLQIYIPEALFLFDLHSPYAAYHNQSTQYFMSI